MGLQDAFSVGILLAEGVLVDDTTAVLLENGAVYVSKHANGANEADGSYGVIHGSRTSQPPRLTPLVGPCRLSRMGTARAELAAASVRRAFRSSMFDVVDSYMLSC